MKRIIEKYSSANLILRIAIGIVIGALLAFVLPQASWIKMLGTLFVGSLKAIAPVLVAILVASSLCQGSAKLDRRFGLVVFFYLLSTYLAAFVAVIASFLFPQTITLSAGLADGTSVAPGGLGEVLQRMLMNIIANPISAVSEANYLGVLFWAVVIGMALKGSRPREPGGCCLTFRRRSR